MRAGRRDKKLLIQSPSGSKDAVGQRTTTWSTVATVWGNILPLKADTRFAAAQSHASTTHRIWIPMSSEIAAIDGSWRVVYGSRVFTIDGIINVGERNAEYELLCTEGLKDG